MKIAVIAPSEIPSSTANSIQVMKVCQALVQSGHEVCLWVPGKATIDWQDLMNLYGITTDFDIRWLSAPLRWRRYDFTFNSLQQAKAWGAEIVYTWMIQVGAASLWVSLPVVVEVHMPFSGRLGPLLFTHFLKKKGKKRLLFITEGLRKYLSLQYPLDLLQDNQMQIAPMGSEPERYADFSEASKMRRELNLPDKPTVGYTGHFYAGRGMNLLFGLAKVLPDVNFLWIGGRKKDVDHWRKELENAGIENVIITGFVENQVLPRYQAASDILLMPYEQKVSVSSKGNTADFCSPMKMFDYLSAGRAIIASDLPVLHEVLSDENAVFCPPDDINTWSEAIQLLLSDKTKYKLLCEQGKKTAIKYTWLARSEKAIAGLTEIINFNPSS